MTALRHRLASVALAGLLIAQPGWAGPPAAGAAPLKLPVATPDWRDQILYLALTDRFDDGDARNNRLGQGEFDRRHGTRNSGSDLAGLARRLDHIQGLGATALWLTARAEDQQLSHQLHQRGMYLVQDILLNHAGDSFADRRGADANGKTAYFKDPAGTPLRAALSPVPPNDVPNPAHRRALRQSHGAWIQSVGVDAFGPGRAFAIPSALPGGMLNVALSAALNDAFSRGAPSAQLAQRIAALKLHARPHGMLNLIDNPAGERYLAGGSSAGLQQAWLAMMTLPGIPTLYDGTEQGFTQPRTSMFAAGGGSGGRDPVHTAAALYRYFASLAELRRGHKVLSRGMPRVLHGNAAQAGALPGSWAGAMTASWW